MKNSPPRLMHVVVDGPWGATRLAESLATGHTRAGRVPAALVLRKARCTPPDRIATLRARGIDAHLLPYKPNTWMMWHLARLCRRLQPDVLFAHGYSLHLWARYAALAAGVPHIVHVEHNRERYSFQRNWQNHWLARRTDRIVCVSEGIREYLLSLSLPADKLMVIPNGVDLTRFTTTTCPHPDRTHALIMPARFSAQKDQATLLRALARLRDQGLTPKLLLPGGTEGNHLPRAVALAESLGLTRQVDFMGLRNDVPELLGQSRLMVLSSHYEGMPLSVLEGMAAGCAVVASDIPGVREVIHDGRNGHLFPAGDDAALAATLGELLADGHRAQSLGTTASEHVRTSHSLDHTVSRYEELAESLLRS